MSYARFGCDGSDVYIYASGSGELRCECSDQPFIAHSAEAMLAHVAEHRSRGQHIPSYVDERLQAERQS